MYSMIPQLVVNSLITSAELALIGLGLTMCFDILKFANFAHTELAVMGAYLGFFFNVQLNWSLSLSFVLAALLTGVFAMVTDRIIFKRMRDMGDVIPMVTSLGLSIAMRNGVRAIWGSDIRVYNVELSAGLEVFGARITPSQVWVLGIVSVSMVGFHLLLKKTKLGKAMRATSDNRALAEASSIDTEKVVLYVWFIGAAFAGLGGCMIGWDTQLDPMMGFMIVIPVFCAVLLGGIGNVYGVIYGSLVLGFIQNFGIFFDFGSIINLGGLFHLVDRLLIPVDYKPAIPFAILVVILLFRPSGIMGKGK
ncbi:MAG: branched-chain amino acid ABC transporter permease [Deltaproteobacteria bacterium]|nr:branched-chain amino acid ABC transporter permease [Deltaproteobacteria bacterium]MBW2121356.1 branched-chain amino acid ABC transporter permease [Deltaproteobacteria bacterium]